MKNLAPLLLIGGAAVLMMGGKKKTSKKKIVFYVGGSNETGTTNMHKALLQRGFDSKMVPASDLAAWFYEPAWAEAEDIIVAVDTGRDEIAGAWATPKEAAGEKAQGMTKEEMGQAGFDAAVAIGNTGAKVA